MKKVVKRGFDIGFSSAFFLLFGWVYIILWLCVVVSVGRPAIYKHTRVGKNGRKFSCLKFRSMVINSAEVLENHLKNNAEARLEWERDFKLKNDPRITKLGKILRKTSLDELPQFWNVFKGDMSIVGPRPVIEQELQRYYGKCTQYYLQVRPGITGPWQVGGRNDLDYGERVRLDTEYAKHWSLMGDIIIIMKTVAAVFARRGSY
ncbi:sugar transferase [Pseudacidovorax sp. NFM-22]|uniref:sugar transferase n=1 Tax=Pseudacidovorax sp. NFM-22 TaxID=2744469 RepID=UPI001F1BD5AC|nr:sugar transferase [Pseudacidovorax sp. NFM-22]